MKQPVGKTFTSEAPQSNCFLSTRPADMPSCSENLNLPLGIHINGEDVFVLSGDLHIGEHVLRAGDFHHADAGTSHGENFSETGCAILAVISTQSECHPCWQPRVQPAQP